MRKQYLFFVFHYSRFKNKKKYDAVSEEIVQIIKLPKSEYPGVNEKFCCVTKLVSVFQQFWRMRNEKWRQMISMRRKHIVYES